MSYNSDELSIDSGQPIELYLFTYNGIKYPYTSYQYPYGIDIDGERYTFNPEFIRRGDNLRLGDSGGTLETCTITVSRTNSIALLYQGAPPELSSVNVSVYRVHGENNTDFITILDGVVSQVRFSGSEAELTITIENVLSRYIPRGTLSYFCQNCIYDSKCNLNRDNYALTCYVDNGGVSGLTIYSSNLLERSNGYFTDGYIVMGNSIRAITKHVDSYIHIKYPINRSDWAGSFIAYPGCSGLFSNCVTKFSNTDNFNGIPYIQPYDAFKHPVGKGAYWVDSSMIVRDSKMEIKSMNI